MKPRIAVSVILHKIITTASFFFLFVEKMIIIFVEKMIMSKAMHNQDKYSLWHRWQKLSPIDEHGPTNRYS